MRCPGIMRLSTVCLLFTKVTIYAQPSVITLSPYQPDLNELSATISLNTNKAECDFHFKLSIGNKTDSAFTFCFFPALIKMRIFSPEGEDMIPSYACGMIFQERNWMDEFHRLDFDKGVFTINGKSSAIDFEKKLDITLPAKATCEVELQVSKIYRYNWDDRELRPGTYYFSVLPFIENLKHWYLFTMTPIKIAYDLGVSSP